MLNKQYDNVLDKVKTDLKYSKAVCLTSDGWTGLNGTNFLAATVHFVNDSTNLKSYLLECEEFTERHTSENIALWLKSVMDRFAILDKVCCVVTDNAPNMIKAINLLEIQHVPCYAHTLNLVVKDAINDTIETTVTKVRKIVKYFKKSSTALYKLNEMQKNLNYKELKLMISLN